MTNFLLESDYVSYWFTHVNLSENTKLSYRYQLAHFENYIKECGFVGDTLNFDSFYCDVNSLDGDPIDEEFIQSFIDFRKKDKSKKSVYITICALKNFFTFLYDMKLIDLNPTQDLINPYYSLTKKDRSLSDVECKRLLKAAYEMDPFTKKYAVLFLLGITCGLRASEIINLRKSQINFTRKAIFVNKGQKTKSKSVHMPTSTRMYLEEYLNHPEWLEWGRNHNDKEVFFFNGATLTYANLRKILDQIARKAKLEHKVTPHQMRHTMARMMFESGIQLPVIKRQLRHKSIRTTILYLPSSPKLSKILSDFEDDF